MPNPDGQVEQMSVEECLRVTRFGKPMTEQQLAFSNACFERLGKLKAEDPAAFTAASKRLGWD
jgi:hypothetical protein